MPVEIRELVIKAVIDGSGTPSGESHQMTASLREEIVSDCVDQVMKILREKSER